MTFPTTPDAAPGQLSPAARSRALDRLRESSPEHPLDVLVIGGGVVGAGTALDAATRGLSTALVEAGDYASGTSSASSKLVHGGLRYLEMLDFSLVHEALQERGRLIERIAPHLVSPVPFLYPLNTPWERPYVGAGLTLYDSLAAGRTGHLPVHRHLTRGGVAKIAPGLRTDTQAGAIRYYDAQVDDARLVVELVRTAASHGAWCASRVEALTYLGSGETGDAGTQEVVGARVRDVETGETLTVHARRVINATGVWTGRMPVAGPDGVVSPITSGMPGVRASKGVHLVVPRDRFDSEAGLILRTASSVLFVIPWSRHWIIGTTDTSWDEGVDAPAATSADIDYLLTTVNTVLRAPLTRQDVVGVYAGLRPLVAPTQPAPATLDPGRGEDPTADTSTAKTSREHVVAQPLPGLTVVAGGKLTTYRVMAADAVDAAVAGAGAVLLGTVARSCTADLPLLGSQGWRPVQNRAPLLAREHGVDPDQVQALLRRYGAQTPLVLALTGDPDLRAPIPGVPGHLLAEVVFAVTHEGARTVHDVLARRLRAAFEVADAGAAAADAVAAVMAPLLGWDPEQTRQQAQRHRDLVDAQRRTRDAPDDATGHRLLVEAARAPDGLGAVPSSSTPCRDTA